MKRQTDKYIKNDTEVYMAKLTKEQKAFLKECALKQLEAIKNLYNVLCLEYISEDLAVEFEVEVENKMVILRGRR